MFYTLPPALPWVSLPLPIQASLFYTFCPVLLFLPSIVLQIIYCVVITFPVTHCPLASCHCVCVCFVCVSGGLWQGIDRSHSWVNSAYAPGGSRSVLRRNPNSSCDLKQVPNPSSPPPPNPSPLHFLHFKPPLINFNGIYTTSVLRGCIFICVHLLFMVVTS